MTMKPSDTVSSKGQDCSPNRVIAILSLVLWGLTAQAVPPPTGVAPVLVPAGGFAIEGDLLANTPLSGAGDWLPGPGGTGSSVLDANGAPLNSGTTFHLVDPFNSASDDTFAGGLKWTDNPNSWRWTTGGASSKTDINNVLLHVSSDANGHTWIIIAADRASTSGDSYIDFEFLQNPLTRNSDGSFTSSGPNGGRTTNDMVLSLEFGGGGSVPDFFAYRWVPSGSGFAYVDATASFPTGRVFVAASPANTAVPFGAFGLTTYDANAFVEAAIDMTALLGNFDTCLSIGVKTIMVKTKTSTSSTATIVDFIAPIQYSMKLGPSADAGPDQVLCTAGDSTAFPLLGKATRGLFPLVSTNWSVVSGAATIDDPGSVTTMARVSSTSATLRLTVVQANGCTESDDVLLTVKPVPAASISGPSQVCPQSTAQFSGPGAMGAYAWSVTGNGSITGPTNSQTVTVTAGSNCGATFSLSLAVSSNSCPGIATADVMVNDTNAPAITAPADVTLECPADTSTNATGVATAQDDCGKVAVSYSDSVTSGCGGTKTIARTWTATDLCGNSASVVQTVTVRDHTPPSLTWPANVILECPADTSTNHTGTATARDTCGAVAVTYSDIVSNSCGGAKVITRIWTATDDCGNATNAIQLITVRDTTRPSLACPANVVLECPADTTTNNTGVATALDACGAVALTYSDIVSNSCAGTKTIWRTWTATDDCGNATNRVQTITVRDSTPPALAVPIDVVLECPADTSTNNTGVAAASDACGTVAITYSDSVSNGCGGTRIISRRWTATDACGNSTNAVQTVTVRDSTPPVLTLPASVVLECPADVSTNKNGVATATDACGAVAIVYSDSVSNSCGNTKTIWRTWTATDACGNASTGVQTLTVRDTTAPTLTCPADVVLECPADVSTNKNGMATASDACSTVVITYSDSVSNSCGGTKTIWRTWTATDACGNAANAVQTLTVRDTSAPALIVPPSVVLECPADVSTNKNGSATAIDACGAVAITYSDVASNSCANTKTIWRTWTATDACGNHTNAVQTLTVRDTTPPALTVPASVVLECPADVSTNRNGAATATDACGAVAVTYSDSVSDSCGGTKVISRLWTATDACGNASSAMQTLTVRDTTAPTVTAPANVVLECPADVSTNKNGMATALDACGTVAITYSDSISNSCGGTKTILRTWTATDACGNAASAVQTLTVRDTSRPALVCPANVVLECPATDTSTNVTGAATATDACGAVTVTYSDVVTNTCGATKTIWRTWTATDGCGNATNAVQTITVRDTTRPALSLPPSLVLECPADTSTNVTGVATGSDACSQVIVRYSDTVSNACGGAKVISRLWTATDACGNATNGVQTLTVRDTTPPALTLPVDVVLECPADTSTNKNGAATALDACGAVAITYSDSVSNSCGGTKTIWRTWRATDACGNSTNGVQTLTVRDTTPPALRLPANLVQECPGDTRTNVTGSATAPDACSSVAISYSDVVSNSCGNTKTVWRTWTATDACGNATNGLQTIVVQDTTKPSLTFPNVSVQCPGDVPAPYANLAALQAAGGSASDTCSTPLSFSLLSDSGLAGKCPGKVTRVYRLTDACGNYTDAAHTITVSDTIAPVLTVPTNVTLECGIALDPVNAGQATAIDNCDTNVSITYTDAAATSAYDIKFYAADSDTNTGPYAPTYLKFSPATMPSPPEARLTGRAADPLRNAVAFGPTGNQLDALTTLNGGSMSLGQIVPFEVVIQASGAPGPERGTVEFTADWATHTTSNNRFGYDTNYMVYAAFVDYADQGTINPRYNARVESYHAKLINPGTIDEQIEGTFRISGIDPGDRVVVEIWVVLDSAQPQGGGTVAAGLISAQKATVPPEPISTGVQTTGIGNLNKLNPLPAPQAQPPLGPLPPQPSVPPGCLVSVINRTWSATDSCGNRSTAAQQISVRDTTAPALAVPANQVLEYPADTSTNATGLATAPDTCGAVTISYSDSVSNSCGGTKTILRTWTASDQCGNTTNAVQTIAVRDSTPPALVLPTDVALECPADLSTNKNGSARGTDLSGAVTITYSDSVSNSCGGTKTIWRTWTATDVCGNSTNAVQTLTVRDTTPPTLTVPKDATLECPADTSTNKNGVATAADTCSSAVLVSYSDVVSNGIGGTKIIARTWTATDECGNSTSRAQTITVQDTTPPTVAYALVDTFSQSDYAGSIAVPALVPGGFATLFPSGLMVGEVSNGKSLVGPAYLLWEASGTGQTALASVLAKDGGTSGRITQYAINPTTTLGGGTLASQTAALTLNIAYNQEGLIGAGPNNFGCLVYSNADDALNGASASQILATANRALGGYGLPFGYDFTSLATLVENLNLSFHNGTASPWATTHLSQPMLVVQCPAQVPAPDSKRLTASDACSSPVNVTMLQDTITDFVNAGHYTILRTWLATDAAGNTNNTSIRILVSDTTPPTLTAPPDRTVTAGTAWDFDAPTAADNCASVTVSILGTVTNAATLLSGQSAVPITRTWVATDTAGNTNTCQQTITVILPPPQEPPAIAADPQCQTIGSGGDGSLSVIATGSGPFTYQWQLNGTNIAGATGSSFTLNGTQLSNAGLYTVVVGNGGGSVTSQPAVINVLPRLSTTFSNKALHLDWPAGFILQSATNSAGPYADVLGAASPYTYSVTAGPLQFFRLRAQPFKLAQTRLPGGPVSISGPGIPGCNFIIQASTNLHDWVNLATNTSPLSALDAHAAEYPVRFYRAVLAATSVVPAPTLPIIASQPVSLCAGLGNSTTLSVTATGCGPFVYQWRLNGTNIDGATSSSLTLSNLQFANSGSYSVVVTSPAGSVTSQAALLTVAPQIAMSIAAKGLTLNWPADFVLQAASDPAGPYADVAGALSPYVCDTQASPRQFFRLRPPSGP
jgi:HYR domain